MAGPVTYAFRLKENPDGIKESKLLDAGKNRPNGVIVTYYLAQAPEDDITLTILDASGKEIRGFSSKKEKKGEANTAADSESGVGEMVRQEAAEGSQVIVDPEADAQEQAPFIPKKQGINRFTWNFRYESATKIPDDKFSEFATAGPPVPPGTYQVRLEVGDESFTESFEILKDPRLEVSQQDLEAQYDLGMKIRNSMSRLNESIIEIRDVREQLQGWEKRLGRRQDTEEAGKTAKSLQDQLTLIEEELANTKSTSRMQYPPPNVPTRLNQKLVMLAGCVSSADAAPTQSECAVFEEVSGLIDAQLQRLDDLVNKEIPAFNDTVRRLEVPAVLSKSAKQPVMATHTAESCS